MQDRLTEIIKQSLAGMLPVNQINDIAPKVAESISRSRVLEEIFTAKRDSPKKPLWGAACGTSWYSCPACDRRIPSSYLFCHNCGQAIDWTSTKKRRK